MDYKNVPRNQGRAQVLLLMSLDLPVQIHVRGSGNLSPRTNHTQTYIPSIKRERKKTEHGTDDGIKTNMEGDSSSILTDAGRTGETCCPTWQMIPFLWRFSDQLGPAFFLFLYYLSGFCGDCRGKRDWGNAFCRFELAHRGYIYGEGIMQMFALQINVVICLIGFGHIFFYLLLILVEQFNQRWLWTF